MQPQKNQNTLLHRQLNLLIIYIYIIINITIPIMAQDANGSCTKLVDKSTGTEISLYENSIIKRSDFRKIRTGDRIATREFWMPERNNCLFELCSYSEYYSLLESELYLNGLLDDSIFCRIYGGENMLLLFPKFKPVFELWDIKVSSVDCYCPGENYTNSLLCFGATTNAVCLAIMNNYNWSETDSQSQESQCAMLFRERNCNGCVFPFVLLNRDMEFPTLNSYNFKSIVVRPGCYVEESYRNGSSIFTTTYTEAEAHMKFKFSQESLNYTCRCEDDLDDKIIKEGNIVQRNDSMREIKTRTNAFLHQGTQILLVIVGILLITIVTMVVFKRRQDKLSRLELEKYVKFVKMSNGQDDKLFLQPLPMESGLLKDGNRVVSLLEQQFNSVCEPNFRISRESFTIGEKIGEGQFGNVFKGSLVSVETAVKRVENGSIKVVESFLREVKHYNSLGEGHENIVEFMGACFHNDEIFIITKYMELGSLKDYLRTVIKPSIILDKSGLKPTAMKELDEGYFIENVHDKDEERIDKTKYWTMNILTQFLLWSKQIADGMEYLHLRNILHVDLAVRNILLDSGKIAKICDFGLSRMCFGEKDYAESLLSGHFPFNSFAPEVNSENVEEEGKKMSIYIDRWAYGCTVWEIFSLGSSPYPGKNILWVSLQLKENHRLPQPELAPDNVYQKLIECWNELPHKRPDFGDLKNFFQELLISRMSEQL